MPVENDPLSPPVVIKVQANENVKISYRIARVKPECVSQCDNHIGKHYAWLLSRWLRQGVGVGMEGWTALSAQEQGYCTHKVSDAAK